MWHLVGSIIYLIAGYFFLRILSVLAHHSSLPAVSRITYCKLRCATGVPGARRYHKFSPQLEFHLWPNAGLDPQQNKQCYCNRQNKEYSLHTVNRLNVPTEKIKTLPSYKPRAWHVPGSKDTYISSDQQAVHSDVWLIQDVNWWLFTINGVNFITECSSWTWIFFFLFTSSGIQHFFFPGPTKLQPFSATVCLSFSHSTIHVSVYQEQTNSTVTEPMLKIEEIQRSSLIEHNNFIWLLYQTHGTFNILRTN